ncbi:MAG: hypothetical protein V4580_17220 [Bacteroidota bacterium]
MKKLTLLVIPFMLLSCGKVYYHNYLRYLNKEPGPVPVIFAPNIVSVKGRFEMGLAISPDGKSIAFGTADEKNSEHNSIYIMNFSIGKWSAPDKGVIPNNVNAFFPMFGPDGNELYFAKSVDSAETDIWVATYKNNRIKNQHQIGAISSPSREAGHGKLKDGSIYFTSNRDINSPCCGDIYYAEIDRKRKYGVIKKVNEINTDGDEESFCISPKGDFIVIQSWKKESPTKHDLYMCYRNKVGVWTIPEPLDSIINSKDIEQRPFISADKKYLFFSRTTVLDTIDSDIYWVTTKSIFKPFLYNALPKIEVVYDKPFRVQFPDDLFKDVNDRDLLHEVTFQDGSKLSDGLNFDAKTLTLSGIWKDRTIVSLLISATDVNKNKSTFAIPVVIK